MRTRDLILTLIDACSDREEFGRTSLQKMAYFAGERLGVDLGHHAYYYGPFSDVVEQEVASLALGELLSEQVTVLGVGSRGPVRKYQYSLTDQGRRRLKMVSERYPEETERVRELVGQVIEVAGSLEQGLLSQAAKTFFVAEATGANATFDELKGLAEQHGWQLENRKREPVERLLGALGHA